ncbi:hypothetical protein BKA57DRAFT_511706 [Linnemannia elongata]|nr:hypothetical protein BKA57DRAFT_511706 [Linnemannia elongata]
MSTSVGWHSEIIDQRKGAGYFLSQTGHPCFKPVDYIKYRALQRDRSSALIDEWNRWLLDLKRSSHEAVRRAAVTASALTQDDIDEYYRDRVSVDREHDALESSRKQLRVTDQQLTLLESTHSMSSPKDDRIQEIARPIQAANSTTSTAGTSATGMSAEKAGPSGANTALRQLPNASTTPPGTPSSLAASSSHLEYLPPYSGAAMDSYPSANTVTFDNIATITGSAADLNASAAVPGLASEWSTSVRDLGPITDSNSAPSSATTDALPTAHTNRTVISASGMLPGSPETFLAVPPSDEQSTAIDADEQAILLSQIEEITHTCAPQEGKACSTCLFKNYQRLSVDALVKNQLKITEIADVVSLMGVFVPSRPTERMKSVFSDDILQAFIKSGEVTHAEWDSVEFNDSLAMKAVKDRKDDVAATLVPMNKDHRHIRIMLETLLEYLPKDEDRSISEYEYTVKHIGPVMQAFFESKNVTSHFPNKDSSTQKKLGLKPDRPDFTAAAGKIEIAWGEFSGPAHENDEWKNLWDFFRNVRYGKAFLDSGFEMAPLFHIIYEIGNYMRLRTESRGMYVLYEVGKFTIPTTTARVASLIATFSTLLIAKKDIEDIAKGSFNVLKRSWGYKDLEESKKARVQRPNRGQKNPITSD